MIHTVKGFGIVDETEVDVFLNFLYDPVNSGNLISGSFYRIETGNLQWEIAPKESQVAWEYAWYGYEIVLYFFPKYISFFKEETFL